MFPGCGACTTGGVLVSEFGGVTVSALATPAMPNNARELAPKDIATASLAFITNLSSFLMIKIVDSAI